MPSYMADTERLKFPLPSKVDIPITPSSAWFTSAVDVLYWARWTFSFIKPFPLPAPTKCISLAWARFLPSQFHVRRQ